MTRILNLLPNAVGQGQARVVYGEVDSPAPLSFGEPLRVVFPDWTLSFAFPMDWEGSTLPSPGDPVLAIKDTRGAWRVVWRKGSRPLGPSGADDTALINDWVGKGNALGPGTFRIQGRVIVPDGVNLVAAGGGGLGSPALTTIVCTNAAAGITFLGNGGSSRDFRIEANKVGIQPFVRGDTLSGGSGRTFLGVQVFNSAQDNVLIQQCQNDVWVGCAFSNAARDNLVLDYGASGHGFWGLESYLPGRYGVHVQASGPGRTQSVPTQNAWYQGRSEGGTSTSGCALRVDDGHHLTFDNFDLSHAGALGTQAVAQVGTTNGTGTTNVVFRDVTFSGSGASAFGLKVLDGKSSVTLDGGEFDSNLGGGTVSLATGAKLITVDRTTTVGS